MSLKYPIRCPKCDTPADWRHSWSRPTLRNNETHARWMGEVFKCIKCGIMLYTQRNHSIVMEGEPDEI